MDRNKLLSEVFVIQDNCLYTAESHHQIALRNKRKSTWFKVAPAILAAVMGTLAASGVLPEILAILAAISASVSAVANILNPDRDYQSHMSAARAYTALKHDARFLHDSFESCLSDEQFCESVRNLHQRYNDLVQMTPETDTKAFAIARDRIHQGIHDPSGPIRDSRTVPPANDPCPPKDKKH